MDTCPSDAELGALLAEGQAVADGVRTHLAGCPMCQAALDRLSDDAELRRWADHRVPVDTTFAGYRRALADRAHSPDTPRQLGGFTVLEELGRGGMGVVYRARDEALRRDVAVKVMRPELAGDDDARRRFVREAQAAAAVRNDHIVSVFAVDDPGVGSPFLVMEYVEGGTVADALRAGRRFTPVEAATVAVQVADGLGAAHAAGLIHRDVKPGNIFLTTSDRAMLADFGLARTAERDPTATAATMSGAILGTPQYMAPEQARGDTVDQRTDVYALGATLYEMLTAEVPFRGLPHLVIRQVIEDEPRPVRSLNDSVPRDLETICQKAMAKEAGRRYATCRDFADDLNRFLRGEPILARPTGRVERVVLWCRRNPRVAALSAVVGALLIVVAVGSSVTAVLLTRSFRTASADRDAAVSATGRAEANFDLALGAFGTLTRAVQQQIGTTPGLLPLKKQLVEAAAAGLENIVRGAEDVGRVDRALLAARLQLGALYLELGRSGDAAAQFGRIVSSGEDILAATPDDLEAGRTIAAAHDQIGSAARYAEDLATAGTRYRTASDLRRRLSAAFPDDRRLQRDRAVSHGKVGDVERLSGRHAAAQDEYTEALRLTEELPPEFPSPSQHLFDLGFVHGRLFDTALARGSLDDAERHANEALRFAEQRLTIEPAAARADVAYAVARLAQSHLRRSNAAAAVPHRRRGVEIRRSIAAAEPASAAARRDLYLDVGLLGDALAWSKDFSASRAAYDESRTMNEAEVAADPSSMQKLIDLTLVYERLMLLAVWLERFTEAADWAGKVAGLYERLAIDARSAALQPAAKFKRYQFLRRVFTSAGDGAASDPSRIAQAVEDLRPWLRALHALHLAGSGHHREATALAGAVRPAANDDTQLLFVVARCHARCSAADDTEVRSRSTDAAIEALQALVSREPAAVTTLRPHPDFRSLRGHPAFDRLGEQR